MEGTTPDESSKYVYEPECWKVSLIYTNKFNNLIIDYNKL